MTLSYDQLMKISLKGYKFSVMSQGMTRTSRNATVTDFYVITEDDGENCTIANLDRMSSTERWSKQRAAINVARSPLLRWNDELKTNANDIMEL